MKSPKVGDKVAVYDRFVRHVGVVKEIPDAQNVVKVGFDPPIDGVGEWAKFRPQQLRRLVPKKYQTVWIWQDADGTFQSVLTEKPAEGGKPRVRERAGRWRVARLEPEAKA